MGKGAPPLQLFYVFETDLLKKIIYYFYFQLLQLMEKLPWQQLIKFFPISSKCGSSLPW